MITRLSLSNWKAYESLEIPFQPGATFVVAHNGIGKTSLIQAIQFALFGEQSLGFPVQQACRVGSSTATVTLDMDLGNGVPARVSRSISVKEHKARVTVEASTNGESLTSDGLRTLLDSSFGLDSAQLSRLLILREGDILGQAQQTTTLNIVNYLATLFGVDRAEKAAEELTSLARRKVREADSTRRDARQSLSNAQLETQIRDLEATKASTNDHYNQRRSELAERRRDLDLQRAYHSDRSRYDSQVSHLPELGAEFERLRNEAQEFVPLDEPDSRVSLNPQDLRDQIEAAASQIRVQLDDYRSTRAGIVSAISTSRSLLEQLRSADATCPVCRRPLSADDARHAVSDAEGEISEFTNRLDDINPKIDATERLARSLENTLRQAASLAVLEPPAPVDFAHRLPESSHQLVDELQREVDELRATQLSIDRQMSDLHNLINENDAVSAASRKAEKEYRLAELANIAAETVKSVASAISAQAVAPLVTQLEKRWESLWFDDAGLVLSDDGALRLRRNGQLLDYHNFSGGEKTMSVVLLRILALQMISDARFMCLDEPLEHLDARSRRLLGRLLAKITTVGPLEQVIVTTYEESLARALGSRTDVGTSHVVYVRSAT